MWHLPDLRSTTIEIEARANTAFASLKAETAKLQAAFDRANAEGMRLTAASHPAQKIGIDRGLVIRAVGPANEHTSAKRKAAEREPGGSKWSRRVLRRPVGFTGFSFTP